MKILLSWSSGKDSAWALHVLNKTRPGEVAVVGREPFTRCDLVPCA